jgi:hypothetical protein
MSRFFSLVLQLRGFRTCVSGTLVIGETPAWRHRRCGKPTTLVCPVTIRQSSFDSPTFAGSQGGNLSICPAVGRTRLDPLIINQVLRLRRAIRWKGHLRPYHRKVQVS